MQPLTRPGAEGIFDPHVVEMDFDYNLIHDSNPLCNYGGRNGVARYREKFGALGFPLQLEYQPDCSEDPYAFLDVLYRSVLGRAPDDAGRAFWTAQFASCDGERACLTSRHASIALAFIHAPEYVTRHPGLAEAPGTTAYDEAFVRALYEALLGREPDADGFAFWLANLRANRDELGMVGAFVETPEFKSRVH